MTEQEIEKMAEERADTAVSTRERNIVYTTFIAGANAMQPEMEKLKEELIHLYKGMKAAGIVFHNNYANINHNGIDKRLKELDL